MYQLNRWLARHLLLSAENAILEVQEVDDTTLPRRSRWQRLYSGLYSYIRKIYDIVGDPFEPWYAKVYHYLVRGIAIVVGRLATW